MGSRRISGLVWAVIPLLTAGFHFYRGAAVDGVIFLVVGIGLVIDVLWGLPHVRTGGRSLPWNRWTLAALATVTVILSVSRRYGLVDTVIFVMIGVVVAFIGARSRHSTWSREPDSPRPSGAARADQRSATAWAVVVVVLCAWELTMYFFAVGSPKGSADFPPLSDILTPAFDSWWGRAIAAIMWLTLGVGLLKRGSRA